MEASTGCRPPWTAHRSLGSWSAGRYLNLWRRRETLAGGNLVCSFVRGRDGRTRQEGAATAALANADCVAALTSVARRPFVHTKRRDELQPRAGGVAVESQIETWIRLLGEEKGQRTDAVDVLERLVQEGWYVHKSVLYGVLKRCIAEKDLVVGTLVHALAVNSGYESNAFLANHIICMYASHGKLEEAMQVFTKVHAPSRYMWASIILAHARHGRPQEAIQLYRRMRESSVKPDNHIFVAVLKACSVAEDLFSGKEVHADILGSTDNPDMFVESCLVDMYAKCGSLEDARRLFDHLPRKNVVIWNALIAGYAQHGFGQEALALYASMQQEGIIPADAVTFVCLLQACASLGALSEGKRLHVQLEERGLGADRIVGNSLVNMYAKCGSLEVARKVFDNLPLRDVVAWTSLIAGYAHHGFGQEALALYTCMQAEGIAPADGVTFVCLLQACANVGALYQGKQLHAQIQKQGLESVLVVGSSLVDMYAKCGSLEHAGRVFDRLPTKNVVTWTAMLGGYAEHSEGHLAMQCFKEMCKQGVEPDDTTFSCLLVACSHAGLVQEGQQYFKTMVDDYGIVPTVNHYNCMVDLLGRSGSLCEAENMLKAMPFDNNVVGWISLLSACKSHGNIECGKRSFDHLIQLEPQNAAAYVLMGNIYARAGMWSDVDRVESLRKAAGACKKPAKACIEVRRKVHEFTVGGQERSGMSSKLRRMNFRLKEEGHVPQTELVLKGLSEQEKEDALCGHAEKLALAYGLLNTPAGTPLLVTKNLRMCNDCHSGTKIMSRLEKREIVVRDAHRVHRFLNGSCSCGDRH